MSFTTIPAKSARLPKFRESEVVYLELKKQATEAGITPAEGVRQCLADYLAHPFNLTVDAPTTSVKDRHWAPVSVDPAMLKRVTKAAHKDGVSVGEAMRQIVRAHLFYPRSTQ